MDLEQFAKENAIFLDYEISYSVVRVMFRDSYVKTGKTPNILQRCMGEGESKKEALHNYTYKIRGKKLIVNHDDHKTRKDIDVPLNLKYKGKI